LVGIAQNIPIGINANGQDIVYHSKGYEKAPITLATIGIPLRPADAPQISQVDYDYDLNIGTVTCQIMKT